MAEEVDARGFSCPQPVLMATSKMKEMKTGELEVLVDNEVSKESTLGLLFRKHPSNFIF